MHTPGPWTIVTYGDGDSLVIHSDDENRVCFMATHGGSRAQWERIQANAALIAAAPDLYEALNSVLGIVSWRDEQGNIKPEFRAAWAALEKAHTEHEWRKTMKVSMIGMLQNAADALDAFHGMLGGDDAEGDSADLMYEHQPKMLAYVLRETARNADELRGDPTVLDEFLTLYCLKPSVSDKADEAS